MPPTSVTSTAPAANNQGETGLSMTHRPQRCCSRADHSLSLSLPRLPALIESDAVPIELRLPYIVSGYRYGYTWKQCIASIFTNHNETWNIGTDIITSSFFAFWATKALVSSSPPLFRPLNLQHLLGAAPGSSLVAAPSIVGAPLHSSSSSWLVAHRRTIAWAFSAYGFAVCKGLSAAAHTFGCRSVADDRFWYGLDFMGLCASVLSSAPASLYAARHFGLSPPLFLGILLLLARTTLNGMSVPHQSAGGKFGWFGGLVLAGQIPLMHRLLSGWWNGGGAGAGAGANTVVPAKFAFRLSASSVLFRGWCGALFLLLTGGILFVSKFPECVMPERSCDTTLMSHVYWHVFANAALYLYHRFLLRLLKCRELRVSISGRGGTAFKALQSDGVSFVTRSTLWTYIGLMCLVFGRHIYNETIRYQRESKAERELWAEAVAARQHQQLQQQAVQTISDDVVPSPPPPHHRRPSALENVDLSKVLVPPQYSTAAPQPQHQHEANSRLNINSLSKTLSC